MKNKVLYIPFILSFLSVIGVVYLLSNSSENSSPDKIVFIDNYRLFEEFEMKKDYDKRIEKDMAVEKSRLDSISSALEAESDETLQSVLKKNYYVATQLYEKKFQDLAQQYTNEVYERLNSQIKQFGKENGYDLILGSDGKGNVMYVDTRKDITETLLQYINSNYSR